MKTLVRRTLPPALGFALLFGLGSAHGAPAMLQGSFPGGGFGHSVADAGDLNKDGWPDLIVGAPFDNTPGAGAGRAFIFFGGAILSGEPSLVLDGERGGDNFGWWVAGIGDVNGDTYDDVAVGAPRQSFNGADTGAVYIYYGGASMNRFADLSLYGETGDDWFGWCVSKAGDMDRDGRDDFVVGAPSADYAGQDVGSAYIFFGGDVTSTADGLRLDGEPGGVVGPGGLRGAAFGWAVSDVPNFRGDGRSAVLVGAPGYATRTGRAYLYFAADSAGQPPSTNPAITFLNSGGSIEQDFGYAVSQGGLISGDSRSDVVIGAPGYFGDRGMVRVYYGASVPDAQPVHNLQINGATAGDRYGEAVSDVGDHDGSGPDEWAVGAPMRDTAGSEAGWVYVYSGSSTSPIDVEPVNLWGSGEAGDHFGFALSAMGGDLDGDGLDDLLIGSPDGNGLDNSLLGIAALVGSGAGIVPVPQLRVDVFASGADQLELVFSGAILDATEPSVWTVEVVPREVAALGRGLHWVSDTLVARIEAMQVQGLEELELRWRMDGFDVSERFRLPAPVRWSLILHEPVPNPFNPSTRIRFELPERQRYRLLVLDAAGRVVRELEAAVAGPGPLDAIFDGRDDHGRALASGVYRLRLEAGEAVRSTSALLIK